MENNYKLIIFDWDGTLMDSIGHIVSSMQATAASLKFDVPSFEQAKSIIGLSLPIGVKKLFPVETDEQVQLIITEYKKQYTSNNHIAAGLFDHTEQLLSALKASDKLLAIATGKARLGLTNALAQTQMGDYFHTSYTADDALSKPDPQMLNLILQELNINAEDAVMIGDTVHDMAMAQRAGIDRIGITHGVHNKAQLEAYAPKAVVDSILQLKALLVHVDL
ncbi:HAD family hydrolase [Thalassotalea sp. PLHSN55]|uniref:HAD family hydrolase n=1 Tax=Thalassotalea sp. PLHSN55 TaxID=3435888 RepID=UPI003F879A38